MASLAAAQIVLCGRIMNASTAGGLRGSASAGAYLQEGWRKPLMASYFGMKEATSSRIYNCKQHCYRLVSSGLCHTINLLHI